jgi:hypothetical protein
MKLRHSQTSPGQRANSVEQPVQFLHRQAGHRMLFNRSGETRILEAFLQQSKSVAISPQYLDAISPSVAEHKYRLRRCI